MRALLLASVSQSLALQSPAMWDVLRRKGFELTFAAARDAWAFELERMGAVREIHGGRTISALRPAALKQLRDLRQERFDLVQIQSPLASAAWRAVSPLKYAPPTIYVAHGLHFGSDLGWTRAAVFGTAEHLLHRRVHAVAFVAGADFDMATKLGWHRHTLVWRLPGAGVETSLFRHASQKSDHQALFVGDLNANKDPGLAVRVGRRLVETGHVSGMTVVGDGTCDVEVVQAAREGWLKHIRRTTDMPALYRDASLLLHTSYREGVPRTIIEALASGTRIVARENRGSVELLRSGVGRLLAADAGIDEWVRVCVDRLTGPRLLDRGQALAERYSAERMKGSYEGLLAAVLSGEDTGAIDNTSTTLPYK